MQTKQIEKTMQTTQNTQTTQNKQASKQANWATALSRLSKQASKKASKKASRKALILSAFMFGAALNAAVATEPDLIIQKADDEQTWIRGDTNRTYTIKVLNSGTGSHTGTVTVTDMLPTGLTAVAMSGTGWTCTVANTTCTRSDTLPSGTGNEYPPITLTVGIGSSAPNNVVNTVTVAGNGESDTSNNSATVTTAVISPTADVQVTKTNNTNYVVTANPTTYVIRVTNNGPSTVDGVTLKDTVVPETNTAYNNLVLNGVTCSSAAGNTCTGTPPTVANLTSTGGITLPTLANGDFYEIEVAATAPAFTSNPPLWEHLRTENRADITVPSIYVDPDTSNNTATDFDNVSEGTPVNPGTWSESTCLDFSSMPDLNNTDSWPTSGYHSITTPEGMTVFYRVESTSANTRPIQKYVPGGWRGDRWQQYFGAGKTNAIWFNREKTDRTATFTLRAYAEYNGQTVPLTLLTGSAESDDAPSGGKKRKFSYVKATTNGTPWALVESIHDTANPSEANNYLEITGTPAATTVEMSVRTVMGNLMVIGTTKADATAADPLVLDNELFVWSGATAQGFCVAQAFDRGDAPTSYGKASHLQSLSFAPALTNAFYGTKEAFAPNPPIPNPIPNAPVATANYVTTNMLAGQPNFEATERGTTATEDLDDAIPDTPGISIPRNVDTYTLNVPYNNNSGAPVTVSGWIDFNGEDGFEPSEKATATAPVGSGNVTLSWSGFNLIPTNTTTNKTYARFRIGSNAAEAGSPTGSAINGEVEDYVVTIGPPVPKVSIEKETNTTQVVYTSASAGSPVTKTPGEFVYTIVVRNALHAGAAQNVQVVDTLPTGLSYESSTVGGASASPTVSGQTLTWNLGDLGTNSAHQIEVTVTAPEAGDLEANQPYSAWKNTATVNASNTASKTSNEVTTNSVYTKLVKAVRNLDATPPITWGTTNNGKPGETLEYCIDFMNYGSVAVETFVLSDTVPPNTTYVANSALVKTGDKSSTPITAFPSATVTESGGVVQATIPTLAPNTPGSMCFRVTIN